MTLTPASIFFLPVCLIFHGWLCSTVIFSVCSALIDRLTDWAINRSDVCSVGNNERQLQSCTPKSPPASLVVSPCCAFGEHNFPFFHCYIFLFFFSPTCCSCYCCSCSPLGCSPAALLFALLLSLPPSRPRLFSLFSSLLILIKEGETPSFINETLNEKGGMLLSGTKKKSFQQFIRCN